MTWLFWLMLAVVLAVVVGVTGIQPKGTRPITQTRLIGVARFVLIALVLVFAYLAFRSH